MSNRAQNDSQERLAHEIDNTCAHQERETDCVSHRRGRSRDLVRFSLSPNRHVPFAPVHERNLHNAGQQPQRRTQAER